MRALVFVAALLLLSPALAADSRRVEIDDKIDFSVFKTFTIREGRAVSRRAEINNPLTLRTVENAIRARLSAAGLKETGDRPDLIVTFNVTEEGGRAVAGRGRTVPTTEGTLVIDITKSGATTPVWRGIFADSESNPARLANNLPADARKLMSAYPPKKR
jgi:hypothetical protein